MTSLADERTGFALRPRYASANIRTWIGFKQFMAMAEEAVLCWFRERGLGPQALYHDHGLGLSIVDSSVQLPAVLEIDDEVRARVEAVGPGRFRIVFETAGNRVLRGKTTVALVREQEQARACPDELAPLVGPAAAESDRPAEPDPAAFSWDWTARYFQCQFSDRVQHGAYVAALEETVDRFLAERGLGVPRLLAERGWIPVVSRARVRLLGDAHMGETVRTTFAVTDFVKDRAFDGVMDCWTLGAGGAPRLVATASILHGYAISRGPEAGTLATLDPDTLAALAPGAPR
ncbi:thioesterase family protein [Amycolatopsis sp. NPDC059090]|uniref:thioesterase family protein n=1 Tax=unclassified Amycolatopsis TaxID=2618356 RepID=UPI00366EC6F6